MKNIIILLVACASLTSCAQFDSMLVKNTGLTSTDAILLGLKTKDRVDLTIKEYNDAKARNLSGKEVVTVIPEVVVESEPKEVSVFDTILGAIGF